jgi:hypothetical protein
METKNYEHKMGKKMESVKALTNCHDNWSNANRPQLCVQHIDGDANRERVGIRFDEQSVCALSQGLDIIAHECQCGGFVQVAGGKSQYFAIDEANQASSDHGADSESKMLVPCG